MNSIEKKRGNFKGKIVQEIGEYLMNVCYLTLMFAAFTQYRRFILAAHDIVYTHYGIAVIEALILGKVIMIGQVFRFGRGLERGPLIYPILYKTFVFMVFCAVFKVIEHIIQGLWSGGGVEAGLMELLDKWSHELLPNSLVMFVAFIPFFAVKELGRVLGKNKIWALFFQNRAEH
ncbi:MAG: hypothetical protein KGZ88_10550 [Methylomicrobium sp.]|nr:hypothetical protein [Methylomicrobium sp.]